MRITVLLLMTMMFFHLGCGQPDPSNFSSHSPDRGKQPSQGGPVLIKPYPLAFEDNQFKMLIIVELVYDLLQFTFQNDEYYASFNSEVIFQEEKSRQTYSRVWSTSLSVKDYELTNRRDLYYLTWDSLWVPAGQYQITFKYQDRQGKQKFQTSLNFSLPLVKNLYAPSPLFMTEPETEQPIPLFFPARPLASWGQLPFNRNIKMLLNAYADQDSVLQISMNIRDKNSPQSLFKLDTLLTITEKQGFLLLDAPFQNWPEGKYEAKIVYRGEQDSLLQQIPLTITWTDKPRSLQIPEYAVYPLKVILPETEYKEITRGNKEERRRKFEEFWKSKDPTPGTAYNEILVEFYERVDSVNQIWSERQTPGWKTDPGRIILLYGQPDEVEDNSLSPVKPYLRWSYFLDDRTLTFTFQAIDGRKRYRLIQEEEIPN